MGVGAPSTAVVDDSANMNPYTVELWTSGWPLLAEEQPGITLLRIPVVSGLPPCCDSPTGQGRDRYGSIRTRRNA